jgi:hypothetical protein
MSYYKSLANTLKPYTSKKVRTRTQGCPSQFYNSCQCADDNKELGFSGGLASYYTTWSLGLSILTILIVPFILYFKKRIQNSKMSGKSVLDLFLVPLIIVAIANSFTVFFTSQFLYMTVDLTDVSSNDIQAVSPDILNLIVTSNFFMHQLPFVISITLLFVLPFLIKPDNSKIIKIFLISFGIFMLIGGCYLSVPVDKSIGDPTPVVWKNKIDAVYGTPEWWIILVLFACYAISSFLIIFSLYKTKS